MTASDRIIDLLRNPGHIEHPPTAAEIAADLGLSTSTVQSTLRTLKKASIVHKLGITDSGPTWALQAWVRHGGTA